MTDELVRSWRERAKAIREVNAELPSDASTREALAIAETLTSCARDLEEVLNPPARRPFAPSTPALVEAIEAGNFVRVSGEVECVVCNKVYFDHPRIEGYTWLSLLCDDRIVKL